MRVLTTRLGSLGPRWRGKRYVTLSSRPFQAEHEGGQSQWKDIIIPVPWGNVAGKLWGAPNVQPILAVHGWEDNAGSYDELAPLLVTENTSVLAIDLPGHGLSSHCHSGTTYNFMDGVTLIRKIVKHFKWEEVTIIGHSYGSNLAFAYSAFFPTSVKSLIGIECVRAVITQKEDDVAEALKTAIDSALYVEGRLSTNQPPAYTNDEMIKLLQSGDKGPMSKKCCEIILKRGARKSKVEGKYFFSRDPRLKPLPLGRMTNDLLFSCASRISCNVLQIVAKPGWGVDRVPAHAETVKLMENGAKRYEQHYVEGSHHAHIDTPNQVASIVNNFIGPRK